MTRSEVRVLDRPQSFSFIWKGVENGSFPVAEELKSRGFKEQSDGPVAHLVERLFCIQEVRSSSLLGSTINKSLSHAETFGFLFF